jgi:two-component system, response regulator PdtaR
MRVVIADDVRPALLYLKGSLTNAGYTVVGEARDGVEAVRMCARLRPDFAILDISMPTPGDVAAREIIAAGTAGFVCIGSSIRQDTVMDALREIGCYQISKPYDEKVLKKELAGIIDAWRTQTGNSTTS